MCKGIGIFYHTPDLLNSLGIEPAKAFPGIISLFLCIEDPRVEGLMRVLKDITSHGGGLEVFKGTGHRWLSFG